MSQNVRKPKQDKDNSNALPRHPERDPKGEAHGKYSASDQAKGQFAHNDNTHSQGRPGPVRGDERRGVEEVPYEDDRPQHFPAGARK